MYWCKPFLALCICLLILSACNPGVQEGHDQYFSLDKFFNVEANMLNKMNPTITKTVTYNGQPQTKTTTVKNWLQELALFIQSDINKPAWRGSYAITGSGDTVIYTAIDTTLHTRRLLVVIHGDKVKAVEVQNVTQNLLYHTTENLYYYPNLTYRIEKHQTVKILGQNNYLITGDFKTK